MKISVVLLVILSLIIIALVFLLCYLIILPIRKVGLFSYLYYLKLITPNFTDRVINHFMREKARRKSAEWLNRVRRVDESELPNVEWVEDNISSKGVESFYLLDNYADEVRPLTDWPCLFDPKVWWDAKFSNEYIFTPERQPLPAYNYKVENNKLSITTGNELDTWIYLVSKQKQFPIFSIEFDFVTHTEPQETLQIDFYAKHLASRFRFDLEQNKQLRFDIVDRAQFLNAYHSQWHEKYKVPCRLRLHQVNHIKFVAINEIFAFYLDGKMQMAVEVKNIELIPMSWFLIIWNGTKIQESLDIEISNFKILHPVSVLK